MRSVFALVLVIVFGQSSLGSSISGQECHVRFSDFSLDDFLAQLGDIPLDLADSIQHLKSPFWQNLPNYDGAVDQVLNPFGGIDVFSVTKIAPRARNIYSLQLHPFGNLKKQIEILRSTPAIAQNVLEKQTYGMLSSGTLSDASNISGGLGALAALEITNFLDAQILDVKYLRWESSHWVEESVDSSHGSDHGKITFRFRGHVINYYLIRANLADAPIQDRTKVTEAYLAQQIEAEKTLVGIPQVQALLERKPYLSVLKAIHQGSEFMTSHFGGLLSMLAQSERLYVDSGTVQQEWFPEFRMIEEYGEKFSVFGVGHLEILQRTSK